jgi:hypothetical protein
MGTAAVTNVTTVLFLFLFPDCCRY